MAMVQTRSELRDAISSARGYVLNALQGVTDGTYDGQDAEARDIADDILAEALLSLDDITDHLAGHTAHQGCPICRDEALPLDRRSCGIHRSSR